MIRDVGHMKKNCNVHCSAFFPLTSLSTVAMNSKDITISVARGGHKISKK